MHSATGDVNTHYRVREDVGQPVIGGLGPRRGRCPALSRSERPYFRKGANQSAQLRGELRFPADVKEVRIRKQEDGLFISPVRHNRSSFFALQEDVPDDFLKTRNDLSSQPRDPL
jgi:virulence-associated protein VagC